MRIARELLERIRTATREINALTRELHGLVRALAPNLLALHGCGPLMAATLIGEVADVRRFRHNDAFARHNGTAPVPASTGNTKRHRLNLGGNRRINYAIHHIALTQSLSHPGARAYIARRCAGGDSHGEAIRALKRHISDAVFTAMRADATPRA